MSDEKRTSGEEQYDPPRVDRIPTPDGPAVTAAGESGTGDSTSDTPTGPEWTPTEEER